jgi:eukaryotic-like serine/threonine-protein kinase
MIKPGSTPAVQDAFAPAADGRYRVERELGTGGMATVYLAHDVRHDRKVAIKVLHPELAAAIGGERFLSEIRTTAKLQHPHILPLLDSGEASGLLFYVMPFVAGETLRSRLERERQLSVTDAVRIAREVADALSHAHAHGIIHRDIKPENILLQDGHALVADFGIALAVQQAGGQRLTQTGLSLGTPQYMSPEQAMGERSVDHRTDIYALGAVTYEMLAGEPPFTGPTVQAIVARLLADEPRSLTSLRRSVPPHVDDAVMRALEKLPADRVATAREFAAALDADGTTPRKASHGARRVRWRTRMTDPLVVASMIVAFGALATTAWQWTSARRVRPRPVVRYAIELPRDLSVAALGLTGPSIAVTPNGNTVAFVTTSRDGTRRLTVRAADDIAARTLPGTEGASQPFLSPDGQWVGFWSAGRLQMIGVSGGTPQTITAVAEYAGATWVSRDHIVLSTGLSTGSRLVSLSPAGGAPRELSRPDTAKGETSQQYPVAVGDGDHLVYASWGAGGTESIKIGLLTISTGRSTILDVAAVMPLGVVNGQLIAVTVNSNAIAVPIDLAGARVTGPPVPVASGITVGASGVAKAALSASGTLAYLSGERESEAVLVDASGRMEAVLAEHRAYGFPRYSPDGRRIALTIASGMTRDVWIYDVAARMPTRLSSGGAVNERPEWSPDGNRVMYRSDRGIRSSIWWQPIDMSAVATPLLPGGPAAFFEAVLTPDGKAIVYQVDTTGADVEYRLLEGDTSPKRIAATAAVESSARVSPNGQWVAFVTDESGSEQVVIQPFPGPGPRVQVSTKGGSEPVWSRDGRRVFYRADGKVMAADLVASPGLTVASRTELFDDVFLEATSPHANYDVSPDGTKFLMLKRLDDQRLIVVHNWDAELQNQLRPRTTQ